MSNDGNGAKDQQSGVTIAGGYTLITRTNITFLGKIKSKMHDAKVLFGE